MYGEMTLVLSVYSHNYVPDLQMLEVLRAKINPFDTPFDNIPGTKQKSPIS